MLIVASTASLEIWAFRCHSRSGRRSYFDKAAAPQIILDAIDARLHRFAGQDIRSENDRAIQARQSIASIHQLFNCQNFRQRTTRYHGMVDHESTRVLRRSAVRQSAYWQLSWGLEELGGDSGRLRKYLGHRGSARRYRLSGTWGAAVEDFGNRGAVFGGRNRSGTFLDCCAIGGSGA